MKEAMRETIGFFFLFNPSSFFFFCLPGGKLGFLSDFSYVWINKLKNLNIGLKTIVVIGQNFWNDCCDLGEWVGCSVGDVQGKQLDFFCMQRRMGTAENEIGEGESVCLWAEGKIVFLLHSANTNPNPFIK